MTQPSASSGAHKPAGALFLSPEAPVAGSGGGGLRSASLLEYLKRHFSVQVASFTLPHHSKNAAARIWRNGWRFVRGAPPLLDRFAGFEPQLEPVLQDRHYNVAVVEHFWCAPYAPTLRPHCALLVLDLHNIESELARTHALAAGGVQRIFMSRFAAAYRRLEREWIPHYDIILVASEQDRGRVQHPNVHVYPNALPEIACPRVEQQDCIVFSGNLEYHPNIQAVRWFRREVWPRIREHTEWRLVGRNPEAIAGIVAGDRRIKVIGPVEDAVAEIARARVCVVPLLSGSGTRFKILESWAASRAVVSTSMGAEGLGAIPGKQLLIADDAPKFAAATLDLLKNADLRRRLGENGRRHYLDRFTWPAAWRELDRIGLAG
jgi:glycosyltransferase involved in cell wall biosynthesis